MSGSFATDHVDGETCYPDSYCEACDLRASELVCEISDAFLQIYPKGIPEHEMDQFWAAVYRLESITRVSSLRKVRP